jgi:SOS-response transcriptional repressor LexA
MDTARNRLLKFLEYLEIGQNAFEKKVGIANGYISHNKGSIGSDIVSKILDNYPDLDVTWLLTGEGSMLKDDASKYGKNNAVIKRYENEPIYVPLISQYAYAGYMAGYDEPEFLENQPQLTVDEDYTKGNYIAIEVKGDSMDDGTRNSICEGDIVVCRELYPEYWKNKFRKNAVFIIVHRLDGIVLKEIVKQDIEHGVITLHSRNDLYNDYDVELADVVKIFYVKEIRRKP